MATYFFDKTSPISNAGFGTLTGNWTDASWSLSGAGISGTGIAWPGAGNVASFGGTSNTATAGTITASGTINLDGLLFQNLTGNQTFSGGTLNFGTAAGSVTLAGSYLLDIQSSLAGTNGATFQTVAAGGLVIVYGTSGLSGAISVDGSNGTGLVLVRHGNGVNIFGSTGTTISLSNTGTLATQPWAANAVGTVSANISGNGQFRLNGDTNTSTVNITGTVSGLTGLDETNLSKQGIALYTYPTNVGTMNLIDLPRQFSFYSIGGATGACYVNSASTASFPTGIYMGCRTDGTYPAGVNTSWTFGSNGQAISLSGGINRTTDATGGTATLILRGSSGVAAANTISGTSKVTVGTVALSKLDANKWVLAGDNSAITGAFSHAAGTIAASNSNALGLNTAGAAAFTMSGALNPVLELSGGLTINKPLNIIGTLRGVTGVNVVTSTISLSGTTTFGCAAGSLSLTTASTWGGSNINLTFGEAGDTGNISVTAALPSGTGTLTKNATGTLTLNGANSFSGSITHNAGVIEANTITASGNNSLGTGTTFTFGGAATLRYTGSTPATLAKTTVSVPASGAVFENNGTGTWTVSSLTAASANTVLGLAGSNTGYNKLSPASTPANLVGFTKTGAGRWISTMNINPSSGSTAVNAGTLVASNSNGTSKLFGYNVTVASGAKIQPASDAAGQVGKCAYNNLTFNGVVGTPARIRIGGSVINPTIYMNGDLTLPASGTTTFDLSADLFKTPSVTPYTLIEFASGKGVVGGSITGKITASGLATGRSAAFNYTSSGGINYITVTIS